MLITPIQHHKDAHTAAPLVCQVAVGSAPAELPTAASARGPVLLRSRMGAAWVCASRGRGSQSQQGQEGMGGGGGGGGGDVHGKTTRLHLYFIPT